MYSHVHDIGHKWQRFILEFLIGGGGGGGGVRLAWDSKKMCAKLTACEAYPSRGVWGACPRIFFEK